LPPLPPADAEPYSPPPSGMMKGAMRKKTLAATVTEGIGLPLQACKGCGILVAVTASFFRELENDQRRWVHDEENWVPVTHGNCGEVFVFVAGPTRATLKLPFRTWVSKKCQRDTGRVTRLPLKRIKTAGQLLTERRQTTL
jgi:hypothetical protein